MLRPPYLYRIGPHGNTKTGRRPLLGPLARLGRALFQNIRLPSMHTSGHPTARDG